MHKITVIPTAFIVCLNFILAACQPAPTLSPPAEIALPATPTQVEIAKSQPALDPTFTPTSPSPVFVYDSNPDLPVALNEMIEQFNLPEPQGNSNEAVFKFELTNTNPNGNWVYALVAPFPTIADEVSFNWLKNLWQGKLEDAITHLLVSDDDLPALKSLLGEPAETVSLLPKDQLLKAAWTSSSTWAIIPFEEIEPRWKVLIMDGQ